MEFNFDGFAFVALLQCTAKMFAWYLVLQRQFICKIREIDPTQNLMLLQYMVGTNDKKIYNTKFDGPKLAINTDHERSLLNLIVESEEALKNSKTRHKEYITKDLQRIIFPKEKRHYFGETFNAKEPKSVSVNYLFVYGLLLIRNNTCYFCKTEN